MPRRRFQEFGVWDTCCEFSLPTCFLTNWKMNEHVYISSTCLTQAGDQLGKLICSLSKAPAISSLSLFLFLGCQVPLVLPDFPSCLISLSPGSGCAQYSQQPHCMCARPCSQGFSLPCVVATFFGRVDVQRS